MYATKNIQIGRYLIYLPDIAHRPVIGNVQTECEKTCIDGAYLKVKMMAVALEKNLSNIRLSARTIRRIF